MNSIDTKKSPKTIENASESMKTPKNILDSKVMAVGGIALIGLFALIMRSRSRRIIETVTMQFPIANAITSKTGTCVMTKIARQNGSAVYNVKVNVAGSNFENSFDAFINNYKLGGTAPEIVKVETSVNEKVSDESESKKE